MRNVLLGLVVDLLTVLVLAVPLWLAGQDFWLMVATLWAALNVVELGARNAIRNAIERNTAE